MIIKPIDTTIESALLNNFSKKEIYEKYIKEIDFKRLLPNTVLILKDYEKYYALYQDANEINFGDFYTHFSQNWHLKDLEQTDLEYYRDYVIPAILKSPAMGVDKAIAGLIRQQFVHDINICTQNDADVSKIRDIIDTYEKKIEFNAREKDTKLKTASMIELEAMDKSKGIPWFLPSLRRNLISLVNGQFVVVSADWGTGKSCFVISQAVCAFKFLCKSGATNPIWYINSEGTEGDVLTRFWSNLYQDKILGGFEEVWERREEVLTTFKANFKEDLFLVSNMDDFSTFERVKAAINDVSPSLIIIDICDELVHDEDPLHLKKLYGQLRRLSNQCPIIATTQSGDTSYQQVVDGKMQNKNQKWLAGSKTYGSKTGKPGAADTIITIGKEDESSFLRYVSVPKKKRGEPVKIVCELIEKFSSYKELSI